MNARGLTTSLLVAASLGAGALAQSGNDMVDPFRIAGNLYYVGSSDIGSYLITTPAGHIVIDAGYESTVPMIEAHIASLGFKVKDVRFLLNTQAHFDHAAGFAAMKRDSGARLVVSGPDADVIERGGRGDFNFGDAHPFPPVTVDRRIDDGGTVNLGGVVLTAHLTPGHTKGCTTWTFDTPDGNRSLHVVDLCGLSILTGTRVSGMPTYPDIEKDYERTFAILKMLPVDIFIGAHASYYDGMEKAARVKANPSGPNPFVDPQGYHAMIDAVEKTFREQVVRERARP